MLTQWADTPLDEVPKRRGGYSRPARTCKVTALWYDAIDSMSRAEEIPHIQLRGRRLRDIGFVIGAKLAVEAKEGVITLTVIERPAPVVPKIPRKLQREQREIARRSQS
ncbi:MAG: hypothetical protein ACREPD_07305 [Stenotrophomonas sp.]|uniref:hypothetical protein n=1 Tax=Stenotrophomonas sp. TaxID=69392 RepID=UPI003D6D03B5